MTWELSLTGLLIGLLVGATGMGGGALMTPLLVSGVKLLEPPATGTLLVLVSLLGVALLGISAGRRLTGRAGERPVGMDASPAESSASWP
jgi:uncharacterized membrane protein YfcA